MIARILVPLDGSPLAMRALPYGESLALATQARLILMRAVEAHALTGRGRARARSTAMEAAERYLEEVAAPLRERGLTVDIVVPYGSAAEQIEEEVDLREIDLVVMATHGHSGLGRWVYGSVAAHVLHATEVPVLLVRAWETAKADASFADTPRILVPLDGSNFAESALPVARDLAAALRGEIMLVRSIVPPEVAVLSELAYSQFDEVAEAKAATSYLDQIARTEVPAGIPVQSIAQVGMPAYLIAELARLNNASLIVMATHGRTGIGRLVMGSVADGVLRQGTTPLLLVHPETDEAEGAEEMIPAGAAK